MRTKHFIAIAFAFFVSFSVSMCFAVTNTWTGASDTNWFNSGNWDQSAVPTDGDYVIINDATHTNVSLTNSTANLASFTITNNCSLIFSNWDTTLNATNVTIENSGILTLPAAFTNNGMSNRVHIFCTDFTIADGGTINVAEKGYAYKNGPGAGGTAYQSTGGGYGGKGGEGRGGGIGGNTYGFRKAPIDPGSGGCYDHRSGSGGGAVRIEASGTATINGVITANGQNCIHPYLAGGSGGGIYITCDTLDGSADGILSANGGNASPGESGGGGGGRIAVVYTNTPGGTWPGVRFSTSPGSGFTNIGTRAAVQGTVYLPDTAALSETLTDNLFTDVSLYISNLTSWAVGSLTVSNCSFTFGENSFQLTVTNNLSVDNGGGIGVEGSSVFNCGEDATVNGGKLAIGTNSSFNCGGNLVLTNGSSFLIYSGMTNGVAEDYGALVSVTGDVHIASNSWIYPISHSTDGGSAFFRMHNLIISSTNAGFTANGMGYAYTNGPGVGGVGYQTTGGGYGGKGGKGLNGGTGGNTYGSTNTPVDPGSGGCLDQRSGYGGGLVRIEASGTATINGVITANGQNCTHWAGSGGSGGGIYIMCCGTFTGGANSVLRANGGNGYADHAGGGGGGRIAVWYKLPESARTRILAGDMTRVGITNAYSGFFGTVSVTGGTGYTNDPPDCAYPGTKVFLHIPPGTTFRFY